MTDIAKILTYEIKKELADRYFGFRKLIEQDKEKLEKQIRHATLTIEQRICLDLARIYILLGDEKMIQEFLDLTGLEKKIFYDPYLLESLTIRKRVFQGVRSSGFTMASRYKNLLLDSYETLVKHVAIYHQDFGELLEARETIEEEIKLFYRKHDLGNIMSFLRSLDYSSSSAAAPLVPGSGLTHGVSLEDKLRVTPPNPLDQSLPIIPRLIPLSQIRRPLKRLAARAYKLRVERFIDLQQKSEE
jgi:hypothetical protein